VPIFVEPAGQSTQLFAVRPLQVWQLAWQFAQRPVAVLSHWFVCEQLQEPGLPAVAEKIAVGSRQLRHCVAAGPLQVAQLIWQAAQVFDVPGR
jgi:hypothetical protein